MKAYLSGTNTVYYKYNITTFSQPVLTSNTGTSSFRVYGTAYDTSWNKFYQLFDNNKSTGYDQYAASKKPYVEPIIILDKKTRFTGFTAKQDRDTEDNHSGLNYILWGSNTQQVWTKIYESGFITANTKTVSFTNNNFYYYYKFRAITKGGYDEDRINFRELSFVGTQRTTTISDETDYDVSVELPILKINKESETTYRALI